MQLNNEKLIPRTRNINKKEIKEVAIPQTNKQIQEYELYIKYLHDKQQDMQESFLEMQTLYKQQITNLENIQTLSKNSTASSTYMEDLQKINELESKLNQLEVSINETKSKEVKKTRIDELAEPRKIFTEVKKPTVQKLKVSSQLALIKDQSVNVKKKVLPLKKK